MSISNILMNIDFGFSGQKALKGISQTRKGFIDLEKSISAVKEIGSGFNFGRQIFGPEMSELLKKSRNEFGSHINNLMDDVNQVQPVIDEHGRMWNEIYNTQYDSLRRMRKMDDATASSVAAAKLDDIQKKSAAISESMSNVFKGVGLEMETNMATIQAAATGLSSHGEKATKKFNESLTELTRLQEGMNPRQMARSMQLLKNMDEAFVGLQDKLKSGSITQREYFEESAKLAEDYGRQVDHLSYKVEFMNEKWENAKRSVSGLFSGTSASFLSTVAVASVIDDAVSAQRQTVETIHQLSMVNSRIAEGVGPIRAMRQTTMEVNASIRDVAGATQISMTRASEALNSLASARVPGTIEDLENLTVTSVRMQQAFGVSEGQAADLFRTLSLTGNLSPDAINGVAESLADVQAVWGMTSEEAQEASAQVGRVINRMTAMGANSIKNANVVAREVGRMVTAFNRAGMSAQEASQMMDRFMDPTKIEDNVLLWHNMGMSVSDGLAMMTGDAASMEGMTENLMRAAHDLRNEYGQNPLALQAMSEAHGLTIQDVNRLANEFEREQEILSDPAAMRAREQQATLENQATQARQNAADAIQRLAALGNVLLQTFIMPLLDILTPVIHVLAGFASRVNEALEPLGFFGDAIRATLGVMILFRVIMKRSMLKLLSPLKMLRGGFGAMFGAVRTGATAAIKGIGSFVSFAVSKLGKGGALSGALGRIGEKMRGLGGGGGRGGSSGPFGIQRMQTTGPSSPIGGGQEKGPSKFMQGIKNLPAKQLMQVGTAMLMVAGAVALLALSFKMLVEVVQEASLGELAAGFGLLVVILGLVAAMAKILANVSKAASPQIAMLGVALLLAGAAVAIIITSMALLFNALEGLTSEQIWGGIAALAIAMVGLIAVLAVMGAIGPAVAPGLLLLGVALVVVAAAFVLFGLAAIMAGKGLQMIVEAMNNMGENFKENAKIMSGALLRLAGPLAIFGAAALIASVGIIPLAIAFVLLGAGMRLVGATLPMLAETFPLFIDSISRLSENMGSILSVIGALAVGLFAIGLVAAKVGIPLLMVAGAFIMIAVAFAILAPAISSVLEGLSSMGNMTEEILPIARSFSEAMGIMALGFLKLVAAIPLAVIGLLGLIVIVPVLAILSTVLGLVANSFMRMGTGIQLFAQNINQTVEGIRNIKSELSGVNGMSRDFIRELNNINTALQSFNRTAVSSIDVQQQISASIDNSRETDEIVSKMDDVIDNLNSIKSNTKNTVDELEKLNRFFRRNRQVFNPSNDVGMA